MILYCKLHVVSSISAYFSVTSNIIILLALHDNEYTIFPSFFDAGIWHSIAVILVAPLPKNGCPTFQAIGSFPYSGNLPVAHSTTIDASNDRLYSTVSTGKHTYGIDVIHLKTGTLNRTIGEYFKRKRVCIAYMEKHCSWTFLFLLPLSNLFHCLCLGSSLYFKTPKTSLFFNPIKYILTSFTTLYLLY